MTNEVFEASKEDEGLLSEGTMPPSYTSHTDTNSHPLIRNDVWPNPSPRCVVFCGSVEMLKKVSRVSVTRGIKGGARNGSEDTQKDEKSDPLTNTLPPSPLSSPLPSLPLPSPPLLPPPPRCPPLSPPLPLPLPLPHPPPPLPPPPSLSLLVRPILPSPPNNLLKFISSLFIQLNKIYLNHPGNLFIYSVSSSGHFYFLWKY
ncbi:uncharacterized protein MONOS_14494 [Monocercomonoides exilis]|uniref:uncharacterized protein n=1 Tax=Monocercomonoides exilis TaxID=2049356 RepID=UPI00355A5034|nr:hypothetical protein MONOS_14494 [Monocercomonoides exilis]|eukprot:MONOS_14494.1-p1 / transcript=MONOS_14494.1 / gene=MONOS_14494 / organism=Monocercomonoides_exilis_PA203 / gene_product=unspecified product / transcript_product=unspecified product / location=Mono_scaffold01012:9607-10212(-) / protein_length=202 / sequence_SO=supercontig / SO=protein_coding / is_pseudo=false